MEKELNDKASSPVPDSQVYISTISSLYPAAVVLDVADLHLKHSDSGSNVVSFIINVNMMTLRCMTETLLLFFITTTVR